LEAAAFRFTVDLSAGTITVTPPGAAGHHAGASANRTPLRAPSNAAARSLIGSDVVTLATSNLTRSAVGEFDAKKVRVRFNVAITNTLPTSDLITPTFPAPPPGVAGVLLFPISTSPSD